MSERSVKVKIKRLHEYAVVPWYAHSGDSGFDLVAVEDVIVEPGQTVKVPTGLAFEIPSGYEMQIRPRSGITSKTKLRVQFGTIDSGFRGEVAVVIDNIDSSVVDDGIRIVSNPLNGRFKRHKQLEKHPVGSLMIEKGDRIAQGVIVPVIHADIVESDELDDSERGDGGFGSSGV